MKLIKLGLVSLIVIIVISVVHGCGKDTGNGVGGKVIITGSGS